MIPPDYCLIDETIEQRRLIYHIETYSEPFLAFLPQEIPYYSSHGLDHTLNIIFNINEFVENWQIALNQDEALLLYLAAWSHDIGCIKNRDRHHMISASLLLRNPNLYESLGEKNAICLKYIIQSHRRQYSLRYVEPVFENIRLRMICAIFRLMDACEICYKRCPKAVYDAIKDTLPEGSDRYWVAHMNILSLKFDKPVIWVSVNEKAKCDFIIKDLRKEIRSVRDTFRDNNITVPKVRII